MKAKILIEHLTFDFKTKYLLYEAKTVELSLLFQ